MARTWYGVLTSDYAFDPATGLPVEGATIPVWDAFTGGSTVTDLLDASLSPVTFLTSDVLGEWPFQGPDGFEGGLFVEGLGGIRKLVLPVDIVARLVAAETTLTALPQALIDATNDAIDGAQANTQALLDGHINGTDPHQAAGYPRMLGTAAGADIWGAVSALPANNPGDYTFLGA